LTIQQVYAYYFYRLAESASAFFISGKDLPADALRDLWTAFVDAGK